MTRENRKTVRGLFKKSLQERVKVDIHLHNLTIKEYEGGIKYYLDANAEKYILLDILDGKITAPRRIRRMIVNLRKSRRTHLYDRSREDRDWNKAWVRVYDEWIAHLNDMLISHR